MRNFTCTCKFSPISDHSAIWKFFAGNGLFTPMWMGKGSEHYKTYLEMKLMSNMEVRNNNKPCSSVVDKIFVCEKCVNFKFHAPP